jgi:hypothetical protein
MPVLPRRYQLGRMTCCCYTNGACENEMAAEPGVAPESADLQSAALTNSAIQRGKEMVPLHGIAPRSSAYRAGALLLSYRGSKKMVA